MKLLASPTGGAITTVHATLEKSSRRNLNDEYIVLENKGGQPVTLTGWTLSDESHRRYLFPQFTLLAGSSVTLRTGLGKNTGTELFWGSRTARWNDAGDTIFLRDADAKLVLSRIY